MFTCTVFFIELSGTNSKSKLSKLSLLGDLLHMRTRHLLSQHLLDKLRQRCLGTSRDVGIQYCLLQKNSQACVKQEHQRHSFWNKQQLLLQEVLRPSMAAPAARGQAWPAGRNCSRRLNICCSKTSWSTSSKNQNKVAFSRKLAPVSWSCSCFSK